MVTIEPLQPDAFSMVADWLSQDWVNQWLAPPWRGARVRSSMVGMAARNPRNELFLVRQGDRGAGVVALADIDSDDHHAMIWYALGRLELSGQGVMSQGVRLVCEHAFARRGLASLHAWIVEGNEGSRRVLERTGFREAGRLRQAATFQGHAVDRVYFDRVAPVARDARVERDAWRRSA